MEIEKNDELQNDPIDVGDGLESPVETKKMPMTAYSGLALAVLSLIISFNGLVALAAGIWAFVQLYKAEPNSKSARVALFGFLLSIVSLGYVMLRNLFF